MTDVFSAFCAQEHAIDLRALTYVGQNMSYEGGQIVEAWNFAGPLGLPMELLVSRQTLVLKPQTMAHVMIPQLITTTSPALGLVIRPAINTVLCSACIEPVEALPTSGPARAAAILDLLANLYEVRPMQTVRGSIDELSSLMRAAAMLSDTYADVTCAEKEGDYPKTLIEGDNVAGSVMTAMVDWFKPFGTVPAAGNINAVKRGQMRLATFGPDDQATGHDRVEAAALVKRFLDEHLDELKLTPIVAGDAYVCFGIDER